MKPLHNILCRFSVPALGLLVFLASGSPALGGQVKEFLLKDGSRIQAEIVSYINGVYNLRSESLGPFTLSEDKIEAIRFSGRSSGPASGKLAGNSLQNLKLKDLGVGQQEIQQMQKNMLSDPRTAKLLEDLQKDPSMQRILKDKELMRAINAGDLGKVSADPKIKSLMNNKQVEEILKRSRPVR